MTHDFLSTKRLDDSTVGVTLMKLAANEKDTAVNMPKRLFRFKTSSSEISIAKLNALSKLNIKINRKMTLKTFGLEYSLSKEDSNHKATGTKQRFSPLKMRSK